MKTNRLKFTKLSSTILKWYVSLLNSVLYGEISLYLLHSLYLWPKHNFRKIYFPPTVLILQGLCICYSHVFLVLQWAPDFEIVFFFLYHVVCTAVLFNFVFRRLCCNEYTFVTVKLSYSFSGPLFFGIVLSLVHHVIFTTALFNFSLLFSPTIVSKTQSKNRGNG